MPVNSDITFQKKKKKRKKSFQKVLKSFRYQRVCIFGENCCQRETGDEFIIFLYFFLLYPSTETESCWQKKDSRKHSQLKTSSGLELTDTLIERLNAGADPEIFERGGPEAIIYKILERGGPKSVKMAFECLFQSFSYKLFANIPPKGGGGAGPLGPSPKSATGMSDLPTLADMGWFQNEQKNTLRFGSLTLRSAQKLQKEENTTLTAVLFLKTT